MNALKSVWRRLWGANSFETDDLCGRHGGMEPAGVNLWAEVRPRQSALEGYLLRKQVGDTQEQAAANAGDDAVNQTDTAADAVHEEAEDAHAHSGDDEEWEDIDDDDSDDQGWDEEEPHNREEARRLLRQRYQLRHFDDHVRRGAVMAEGARSGHVAVLDKSEAYMWVYGGYSQNLDRHVNFAQLLKFHLETGVYEAVRTHGAAPSATCSQSVVRVGHNFLFYGGTSFPFAQTFETHVHMLDGESKGWTRLDTTGTAPTERFGQTLVVSEDERWVFCFGGTNGHEFFNDVYRLDLRDYSWELIKPPEGAGVPSPRYKHEAVRLPGNKFVVIGGGWPFPHLSTYLDQIWEFDMTTCEWQPIDCCAGGPEGLPPARRSHTCVYFDNSIFMMGGADSENVMEGLWRLDLATHMWHSVEMRGNTPSPQYFHTAVCTAGGRMIVFGGVVRNGDGDQRIHTTSEVLLNMPTLQELCLAALRRQAQPYDFDTQLLPGALRQKLTL